MIQKKTFLKTSDKTNVKWMQTIHLYKGFNRKSSKISLFLKNAAKKVKAPKIEYKGFKRKYIKKGDLIRSLIIKTIYTNSLKSTFLVNFLSNSTIIIKKKNLTRSKYFFGIISKCVLRKKMILLFNRSL